MDFLWVLMVFGTILFLGLSLLAIWAVYFHLSNTDIPPKVSQPFKLRVLHCLLIMLFGLVAVLKKMRLSNGYDILRSVMDGIPPGKDPHLSITNLILDGLPVRMYQPRSPCDGRRRGILYFHGGIGLYGSVDAYERVCRHIAKNSNSLVASVEYRLAPTNPYPTQFLDCLKAAVHFLKNVEDFGVDPASVIICGDSSGGTLAAAVCQSLVSRPDLPKVRSQILIYPFLQGIDFNLPSYQRNGRMPLLSQRHVVEFGLQYLQKDLALTSKALKGFHMSKEKRLKYGKWLWPEKKPEELECEDDAPTWPEESADEVFEPTFSPLIAEDAVIRQLPEMYILTCTADVFMDDGCLYKKRLEDNGVKVTWYQLEDGFHGVVYFIDHCLFSFAGARLGLDSIVDYIKSL
ncbi:arylacetamide deacetylase-like 4 [Sceloporus undulatus]|uniref:arylacetamide deacetylase-like 4 n=1 Tax=Sceloporus undulatus TaxID=8520 RepID=UPI001C4B5650|nr:arylacetamide deacetylase-like 4 [Sceloporus undulatus]